MAISTISEPVGQGQEASASTPGPGRSALRERFDGLPSDVRDSILNKHRDINHHYDWWDNVYDDFTEEMAVVGIEVDRMYFSGFSSQGDGACFEGSVSDWSKFLSSCGYENLIYVKHATEFWHFKVQHQGHYYHENCTTFSYDMPLPNGVDDNDFALDFYGDPDDVDVAVTMALLNQLDQGKLEAEFTTKFKDHMRSLYRKLEREYEHLTSDDAVLDALEANDLLEDAMNELE